MAILKDALVQGDLVTTGDIRATAINVSKGETNVGAEVTVERSDTGTSLFLGVGSGGTNHGVYSNTLDKWMVYADDSSVYLNGNAETASTLSATLPVTKGGTGVTAFEANRVIMSGSTTTANLTSRAVTNNTATSTAITANTNLITANTLRYAINRTTSVAAADTNYTTVMARGISLRNDGTYANTNGTITFQYN